MFDENFSISIILDQNETLLLRKNFEIFAQLKCGHGEGPGHHDEQLGAEAGRHG